jgi:hypothetical protein
MACCAGPAAPVRTAAANRGPGRLRRRRRSGAAGHPGAWDLPGGGRLLGHAVWDAYHHRVNRVVVRSLAEFCLVLDVVLAVAIVLVTLPR